MSTCELVGDAVYDEDPTTNSENLLKKQKKLEISFFTNST